jgi:hypothetical protein
MSARRFLAACLIYAGGGLAFAWVAAGLLLRSVGQ